MCSGARKRSFSINDDASSGPSKCPRRDGMHWARASRVSKVDLNGIPVSRGDAIDTDDHNDVVVDVPRYAGDSYRDALTQSDRRAREVASVCTLPVSRCDWDNEDVLDYIRQGEHLNSRRFGVFPIEG